jgi:hypothetical protein
MRGVMTYYENQIGWLNIGFMLFFLFLFLVLFIFQIGDNPIPLTAVLFIILTFITVLLLFFRLSVSVTKELIVVKFGVGIIKKSFKISDVAEVKKVRTKWYHGWGIKSIKNGWLYNIHGLDALELTFKNSKKRILIGTKPQSNLEREVNKMLS